MVIASYAASRRGLLLYMAAAGPIGGLVSGLIVLLRTHGTAGAVFFVVLMGMGLSYAYYFGFRQIYLVELTSVELRWRHALRGGVTPLSDVRSIRCSKVSRRGGAVDVATVEFTNRGPLKFQASAPGLTEFLAKLHDIAPQVTVESPGHSLKEISPEP
jgi:hypothetical protein